MGKLNVLQVEKVNSIILGIYNTKDITEMRTNFLREVKGIVKYDFAVFDLTKFKDKEFISLCNPIFNTSFSKDFEEEFALKYEETYFQTSYLSWVYYQGENLVFKESDFINDSLLRKNKFVKECLEPTGLSYGCCCTMAKDDVCIGALGFGRENKNGDFSEEDLYILKLLQPHLTSRLSQYVEARFDNDFKKKLLDYYKVTKKEIEVINLILALNDNLEISKALKISQNTVKKHISNIFNKLDVSRKNELILLLQKNDYSI